MEQNPYNAEQYDTEANRKAYDEYVRQNSGFTIEQNGQTQTYTGEQAQKIRDAYKLLNSNAEYAQSAYNSYGDNDFDRYAMQNGLPSRKLWNSVLEFSSGGGIKDNYGNLSDAQWNKISELWQKDWQYGLTDEDVRRKELGLAPASYDDMYKNTMLDMELKANGLPPSKLLNGKLGETYREWENDAQSFVGFNDAVTRRMIENEGKMKSADYDTEASGALGIASAIVTNQNNKYSLQDAINDTMNDPKWREYANKHYGYSMELPDRDSEDYLSYDDNGNSFIDEEKYAKDLEKAQKNNIALESDEFALTNDGIKKYYDEYAALTKADIDAEKWFTDQGINFDYGTRFMNESYLKKMDDFAIANAVKENGGITVESLFPGVEISEAEKIEFQPIINNLNRVLAEGGASALDDYMASGDFKAAVKNVEDQRIVATMRERYADVPGYDEKPDSEVLHDYWKNIGKEYNMSDEDIAKLESGEITVQSYMTGKCSTDQNARDFAEAQYLQYCENNNLPKTREEWQEAISASKEATSYVGLEVGDADRALLNTSEESWDKMLEYWTPIANKYSTWQEAYNAEDNGVTDTNHFTTAVEEWEYARNIVSQANTAKGIYANIKAINRFYDPSKSWDQQPQYSRQMWDAAYGYRQTLLADALSYSPEFASKTGDKDYINQRFEQIVNSYGDEGIELNVNPNVLTLTALPGIGMTAAIGAGVYDALTREKLKDIHEYATDEDKAKVVYMFDTNGNTTQSSTYLQSMMHQWDAERRADKEEATQYFNAEGKTGFGRWAGAVGTMLHSSAFGMSEGVVNLLTDTASLAMGKDIFSSNRMTATSDRMANLSKHLEDKDGNKIGSFAVNLIPSMAQSGMGMALATMTGGASEAFTLALMGTQAYSGTVDSALRNGASAEQAYVYGLMSGANEMIFEKLSLDKFIADVDVVNAIATAASASGASTKKLAGVLFGSMLKHVGTQGFVEGSEELFTSIANQLCENLILGSKSAFNKTVEHYMQAGMSEEDARSLAAKEIMQDITVDFIGGFISGGLMAFGGDIIQTRGGKYIFDRTGMTDFLNQTHDLSLISADSAIAYAKNNLSKGSGGEYTLESTQKVFSELRKQGADSATLRRVMNAISDDATQGARTVMESEIGEQRRIDEKKLIGAASKYVYNKRNGKASVSASEVARVTNEYLDNLSNTVQQSDIRNVQAAVRAMQAGYVEEIKSLAGRGNMQTGYRVMNDYYNSLSVEAKDEIAQLAERPKIAKVFARATTNDEDAGRYTLAAAIFEYATKDGNALVSLDAIFGDSAAVAPNAIENACLDKSENAAKNFIDAVWAGIGMLHTQDGSHLFKAAQHGMNAQAYVASQMALARSMPKTSMSRAMYDYIIKYGATSETMDLLTAANIYESQGNTAKTIATNFGHFYTNSELSAITSAYDKAETNYNSKTKIMEAHRLADATALAAEQGRVAALEARVAEIQPLLESNTELADAYAKTASELQSAKDALNKLVAEQNKRMASTEADLESARAELAKARMAYQMAMRDHSAQYVQRFGANLEAIKGGQRISHAELSRMNALVTYGTAENLNDINEKILASEKSAAVALGRALGADVQCVSFGNDAFLQEHDIPEAERESAKKRKGFRDGGTIYLNTDVMKADVGSLTNEVLLHEIGHYLENSIDDYKKYAKFAKDFLIARDGLETYNAAVEQFGADELVAEFTRQVALADPRAVAALCKSAPNMSMRVFQWLTNTRNKMTSVAASQSKIIRDAQRAFAKGLKAYRGTNVRVTTTSESAANIEPTRDSLENALRAMDDRARLDEQNAAQQTQEQTAQPEAPSETTEATAETEAEATTQTTEETTPTVEEAEEVPAQPVAEESEQPAEAAEEMPAEETTAEEQPAEEPKEDFADVVLEEPQGDPDYLGYDAPTEVGKVESIKGESLAEDEYFEDENGNKFIEDVDGNLVPYITSDTEQKNATTSEPQTEQPAETAQGDRGNEAQNAQLPFDLTSETRQKIMRVVAQMRAQNSDSEGRVPKKTNDTIAKIVKNQVKNDANYVATSEDVLDAYAEQFKAQERETEAVQGRHDWTTNYRSTENRNAGVAADSANSQAIEYYTEYDPQALAVKRSIDGLSEQENRMSGKPRMIQTNNGYMVARKVSMDGFSTGNPMFNADRQSIAMIAPVSEFRNGDVKQAVPVSRCTAVVVPGTDAYASVRADARSAGANVYAYDESDSTQFDRAIDRAANTKKVQFMPEMTYDEWLKRYDMIPKGTNPRVDRPVPRQTTDTNRVSRMVRTGMEAPVTTEDTAERIRGSWLPNGTGTFEPVSNARTLEKARGVIERAGSIAQAAEDLHRDVANGGGKATDLLARAELLYAEMQDPNTDLTDQEREQIFGDMVIIASDAGRALQLATELKRMTPDGHIAYIEQVGKRMEDRYNKRTGKRTHLELTQEEKDKYHRAVTQEQREEVDKEVGKRWAEETSDLTLLDRIRNWRYFSMLGNPRTHFRNMVGNALMNPIARMKDTVNAGLQAAFGIDRSERTSAAWTGRVDDATKAWVNERLKEALPVMQGVSSKYMEEIASNAKPDTDIEGGWFKRTITALTQPVQSARLSNSDNAWGRFWNKLSYANSNALEMEDAFALGMRFRSVMYQLIKARDLGINSMTEQQQKDIMEVAMEESLRATFRDASKLADALNRFANTNKATRFAMEAIVPFKKTPINIAKRSFEYSPIGLATGLYKTISNETSYKSAVNSINSDTKLTDAQKQQQIDDLTRDYKRNKIAAIDRLAQGTTGSILTAIGIFAASMGWISIGRKDDEGASFEQGLGKNAYSLNIGDVSIDLSAFSPAAVPMLMGTALYQSLNAEHDPNLVSSLISVLTESIDPITEMSMLSGIADALSGIGSQREDGANTRWAMQIAGNALESYVGQFVPTFVGQTSRAFDPYARSYTAGDDYWASKAFGSEIGTSVKGIQNKIGLGWLSEPKVNLHGEEQRNYTNFGSWVMNLANNWILPATIKMDQKNEIDDELVRLYGVTDSGDLFPTKPSRNLGVYTDKKTGTKQNIKITSDSEYTQYAKEYGQTVYDMLDDLIRSPKYRRMTDEQKAEAVADIIDQAKSATRKRWKAQKVAGNKK